MTMDKEGEMAVEVRVIGSESDRGKVIVRLQSKEGVEYSLPLSVFDVSTLVSMLYASRAEALNQQPDTAPEVMLPLTGLSFGEDGESARQILRVHTTPETYQDFSPEPGTPQDDLVREFSDFLAKRLGQNPKPWGSPGGKH